MQLKETCFFDVWTERLSVQTSKKHVSFSCREMAEKIPI